MGVAGRLDQSNESGVGHSYGAAAGGSIRFHVDQNIAVVQIPGACDMTSLTVTPFGAAGIEIAYNETNVGHCRFQPCHSD